VHSIPILGLYPNYLNKVLVTAKSNNHIIDTQTVFIQTAVNEVQMPEFIIDVNQVQQMQPGFQMISIVKMPPTAPTMIDAFGKIRWYLDFRLHPDLINLLFDTGLMQKANNNFLFADRIASNIYEVEFFGNVINTWPMSPYEFHHSVTEKADGNLLATTQKTGTEHLFGGFTNEDKKC